jgi:hypothetical protein
MRSFMTFGGLFLLTGGIEEVRARKASKNAAERVRFIQSHALRNVLAVICVAIGFYAIHTNKVRASPSLSASVS